MQLLSLGDEELVLPTDFGEGVLALLGGHTHIMRDVGGCISRLAARGGTRMMCD